MSDLERKIENARHHVAARWTEDRARRVEARLRSKRAQSHLRRRLAVVVMAAAALLTVGVAGAAGVLRVIAYLHHDSATGGSPAPARPSPPGIRPRPTSAQQSLRLDDGSSVTPRDGDSTVIVQRVAPDRVDLGLSTGAVRMDIVGTDSRVVHVAAGPVSVEASEGIYTIERIGDRVHVAVERGDVRVMSGLDEARLGAGGARIFPGASLPPLPESVGAPTSASAESASGNSLALSPVPMPPSAAPGPARSTQALPALAWRVQAEEGDFDNAYRALRALGTAGVRDEAGDLLLAADVARLSQHPADAIAPLKQTMREHPGDPRAPLAAFTLGRVLLEELGRPGEAAQAFAQARELGPGGPLEEDALAREVEASSRAGEPGHARSAAALYLARYPNGRRLRAVRKFGGVD